MCEFDTPNVINLPLLTLLCILRSREDEQDKEQLWMEYIANIVPLWAGEEARTYREALEEYEASKSNIQQSVDTSEAYSNAKACAEALERARG